MIDYLILDVDNLAYRNWFALHREPFAAHTAYGVLRDMRTLRQILGRQAKFLFCFDGGDSLRKKAYPNYKSNRVNSVERNTIRQEIRFIKDDVLPSLGYANLFHIAGYEADDLMGFLCSAPITGDSQVCLVSTDTDLYQLLHTNYVSIYDQGRKHTVTTEWVWKKYGVQCCEWVLFKSLMGCKTDNIPGVQGVGVGTAREYIRGSIKLTNTYKRILSEEKLILANQKLIKLPYEELETPKLEIKEDQLDPEVWDSVVSRLKLPALVGRHP